MTVFPRRVQWQPLVPNDSDSKACQGFMILSRSMNLTETLHHPAWYQITHRQPFTGGKRPLHIVSKRLCVESWQNPITGSLLFRLRYVHIISPCITPSLLKSNVAVPGIVQARGQMRGLGRLYGHPHLIRR